LVQGELLVLSTARAPESPRCGHFTTPVDPKAGFTAETDSSSRQRRGKATDGDGVDPASAGPRELHIARAMPRLYRETEHGGWMRRDCVQPSCRERDRL
jgi:hypothetical protein